MKLDLRGEDDEKGQERNGNNTQERQQEIKEWQRIETRTGNEYLMAPGAGEEKKNTCRNQKIERVK